MSTTAGTWFYDEPEHNAYLITERLNATFWTARVVEIYWRCIEADPPFRAMGYMGDHTVELEWVPNDWLSLTRRMDLCVDSVVEAISKRILAFPATLAYGQQDGTRVWEWHRDGGQKRWSEIQGHAEFLRPERL